MRWRLPVWRPTPRWYITWILSALLAAGSRAGSFTVTSTGDQGPGSLRAAIEAANAPADAEDTINLIIPDGSTISLASQLPDIGTNLILKPGLREDQSLVSNLTIQGDASASPPFPLFRDATGETAVVDLALEDGAIEVAGGAKLSFDLDADQTLDEVLRDAGAVEKLGDATLLLTGENE